MSGSVTVVVGGQFGSESKGAACGFLAERDLQIGLPHAAVRVGGSQAGHSVYDDTGTRWALRHIPVAAVTNHDAKLLIARGSEIDPLVLEDEITRLESAGIPVRHRLRVDPSATIIEPEHLALETDNDGANLVGRVGSTGKGVGAARAARIMRTAQTWGSWIKHPDHQRISRGITTTDVSESLNDLMT